MLITRQITGILSTMRFITNPAAPILARATALAAPVHAHGKSWSATLEVGRLRYRSELGERLLPRPVLQGPHQVTNAAMAVACLENLAGVSLPETALAAGLRDADWPGRLQRLGSGPLVDAAPAGAELWLDGGHNPDAGRALAESLSEWSPRPLYIVFAMLRAKDPEGYLGAFRGLDPTVLAVPIPGEHDCLSGPECLEVAARLGFRAEAVGSPLEAVSRIRQTVAAGAPAPRILIAGSLYLAGSILAENG